MSLSTPITLHAYDTLRSGFASSSSPRAFRIAFPLLVVVLAACADAPAGDTVAEVSPLQARDARDLAPCPEVQAGQAPDELRCTGLYSDWGARTIDSLVRDFSPGFQLWSDGAKKSRFIYLPPGTTIDATNMNGWVFPIGTKIWKEFRLHIAGSKEGSLSLVETRMLQKSADGRWTFATYVWTPEQDAAKRVTSGIMPFPGTESYEVPAERSCKRCHGGRPDSVLGFEAVLLAAPEATGLTYDRLVAEGRLRTSDKRGLPPASALQIPGSSIERNAVGRIHANCGISCHHPDGPAPFSMRVDTTGGGTPHDVTETSVFREAIGQESFFTPANGAGIYYRIRPTDEDGSTIFYRLSHRDAPGGFEQMPPLATHITDPALIDTIRTWIRSMTDAPYPAPGPR